MRRLFNRKQRITLRLLSGNLCGICGNVLKNNFHADHKIPFSKSGKAILKMEWLYPLNATLSSKLEN